MKLPQRNVLDRHRWSVILTLAILTLAVGLGAGAVGFTVLDRVLLRPLPFPQSETLYALHHTAPGLNLARLELSDATYWLYRQSRTLDGLGIYRVTDVDVTGDWAPERLTAALVSAELLPMLGAVPVHGRGFVDEEEVPGGIDAVMIGAGYWRRRFGGENEILGQRLIVDGRPRTIVGVLPSTFRFPSSEVDLWMPLALDPETAVGARFEFSAVTRLPSRSAVDSALGDLRGRLPRLVVDYPQSRWTEALLESSDLTPVLIPLKDELVGGLNDYLWAQAVAVGLLLLAACLNVATLLLVRAEDRRPETALRVALGADRRQLLAHHLKPGLGIGAAAGVLGLGFAVIGLHLLATHGPEILSSTRRLTADGRTVLLTLGVALALGTALGLLTGLRGVEDPARWLRSGGATPAQQRERTVLVVLQVAVATALCTGAATLGVGLMELRRVDPGFEVNHALSFDLRLPKARYADADAVAAFYGRALESLASLPGVASVGGVHRLPLTGGGSTNGWTAEGATRGPDEGPAVFATRWASEGYFQAMDIPLLRGRAFEPADRELVRPVAVISHAFATHFWGDEDPLGRRIALGTGENGPWYTVVGVVGDVRDRSLSGPPEAMAYLPLITHLPRREAAYAPSQLSLVLRGGVGGSGFGPGFQPAIRQLISELDPELPISRMGPLEHLARNDLAASRFALTLLLATAGATGVPAVVGLFGLIAYWVRSRRRDFGVRLALGADPRRLLWQVHGKSLRLTAIGVVLGLVGAGVAGGYVEHLIYGVRAIEPWIYLTVALLFLLTALVAGHGPARHAAKTDPRQALRQD